MIIYIDNVLLETKIKRIDTLEKIIHSVEKLISSQGRILTEILIDGEKCYFAAVLKEENIREKIGSIEFFTKAPKIVLIENLREMTDYIGGAIYSFEHALYLLKHGLFKQGYHKIIQEMEVLELISQTLEAVSTLSEKIHDLDNFETVVYDFNHALERLLFFITEEHIYSLCDTIEKDLLAMLKLLKTEVDDIYYCIIDEYLEDRKDQ